MERALGFQRVGFTGVCFGSLIATVSIPEFSAYCGLVRHPSLHLEWKQIQQQGCDIGGKGSSYYGNCCFLALNGASGDDCAALCYRASIVQSLGKVAGWVWDLSDYHVELHTQLILSVFTDPSSCLNPATKKFEGAAPSTKFILARPLHSGPTIPKP